MWNWLTSLTLILGAVSAHAGRIVPADEPLRERVRAYLHGRSNRAEMKDPGAGALGTTRAALVVIEEATKELTTADETTLTRVRDVTSFAADLLAGQSLSARERRTLSEYLRIHLQVLRSARFLLNPLLNLFVEHDLWTPGDFMAVYPSLREPVYRRRLFRPFVRVKDALSAEQLEQVREAVTTYRSSALDHLALLAELDELNVKQAELLFERLAQALTGTIPARELHPREARWIQLRALERLRQGYEGERPEVREAYARVSARAEGNRLATFYRRFAAGQLRTELNEHTWRDDPVGLASSAEDNVVDFGCARRLSRRAR